MENFLIMTYNMKIIVYTNYASSAFILNLFYTHKYTNVAGNHLGLGG